MLNHFVRCVCVFVVFLCVYVCFISFFVFFCSIVLVHIHLAVNFIQLFFVYKHVSLLQYEKANGQFWCSTLFRMDSDVCNTKFTQIFFFCFFSFLFPLPIFFDYFLCVNKLKCDKSEEEEIARKTTTVFDLSESSSMSKRFCWSFSVFIFLIIVVLGKWF